MKNIIAVSAQLKHCSIAISYEDRLYETNEDIDAASNLVWLFDNLVKCNSIDLQKIDGIIAAAGPCSFTGTRVSQSFAKGLALALKLPAANVNYFDIIENICAIRNFPNAIIVIRSEKKQAYYRIGEEIGISPPELLATKIDDGAVLMGDAADEIASYVKNKNITMIPVADFRKAKYLLEFAHLITSESLIQPFYISHSK
ncbi:MAG: hypothetical protein LBB25_03460 [Holosporaceae bacterium]|jgi:tRNA A37 threonylcarbamoyladenosine modification protein TsaB|nr:hypothetical protein [Holosporaceae bacterium]